MKTFKRGETIFRKDDPGTHLFLVLDGAVKIALPGELGQEALVAFVRSGEFFGELALLDRSKRSATATALEDTRAGLLAGDDFVAFLESHPAATRVVLEALAGPSGAFRTGSRISSSSTYRAVWRSTCSTSRG